MSSTSSSWTAAPSSSQAQSRSQPSHASAVTASAVTAPVRNGDGVMKAILSGLIVPEKFVMRVLRWTYTILSLIVFYIFVAPTTLCICV